MVNLPHVSFGGGRLPSILQAEVAECGLACLAMISCYHGHRTDLRYLRSRFPSSLKGMTLVQLEMIGGQLDLESRALKLKLEELPHLQTPCVLHWSMNHFVVLAKASDRMLVVHDPARGTCRLSYEEASKQFTGVALELWPKAHFAPADTATRISLGGLIGKVAGWWQAMLIVFVMALVLEGVGLLAPMFNQWVVDEALQAGDRPLLDVLVLGFALLQVFQTAIGVARSWTILYLSTHLNLQWMANAFTHLIHLPVPWYEKRHLGDVVSRFGSIGKIQGTLTTGAIGAVLDGLMATVTLVMMFVYSGQLAVLVLGTVLLYALLRAVAYKPLREASKEALSLSAAEQTCFLETVRAVQAIKLFGAELDRRSRWLNTLVDSVNRGVRTQKFTLWFSLTNTAIVSMQRLVLFWLGAHLIMDGKFTVGMLFAFSAYAGQFSTRMTALIDRAIEFRMLGLHCERLADILLTSPEGAGNPALPADALLPEITFSDVSFRYAESEPWILRHVTFSIRPGESVAIVGSSGCGKTTLVKLILGLATPTEGQVLYGGIPLESLDRASLRKAMSAVMQNDLLLSGSLADNISFFTAGADQARIEKYARIAAVHEDILSMAMGYQTLVGDMGSALSGGQKQRVLLARALFRAPKLLVLDEATSHLDVPSERAVNAAISQLQMTRICVAHRPDTIAMAKRLIRLEKGVIVSDTASGIGAENA